MAFAGRAALLDKPMSVEQIVKAAAEPFFDPEFSVQNWFRTADLMLKQVGASLSYIRSPMARCH